MEDELFFTDPLSWNTAQSISYQVIFLVLFQVPAAWMLRSQQDTSHLVKGPTRSYLNWSFEGILCARLWLFLTILIFGIGRRVVCRRPILPDAIRKTPFRSWPNAGKNTSRRYHYQSTKSGVPHETCSLQWGEGEFLRPFASMSWPDIFHSSVFSYDILQFLHSS